MWRNMHNTVVDHKSLGERDLLGELREGSWRSDLALQQTVCEMSVVPGQLSFSSVKSTC